MDMPLDRLGRGLDAGTGSRVAYVIVSALVVVVVVFPSVESYVRLTICYLVEYSEDWGSELSYIREDKILGSLELAMSQPAN